MAELNREGFFRGRIEEFGVREEDSKAIGIALRVRVTEEWNAEYEQWFDIAKDFEDALGVIYIKRKDGALSDRNVHALVKFAGWSGRISDIHEGLWMPKEIQIVVKKNEYKGKTTYRIAFVNDYNRQPGGSALSNVTLERAAEIQASMPDLLVMAAQAGAAVYESPPQNPEDIPF